MKEATGARRIVAFDDIVRNATIVVRPSKDAGRAGPQ